MKATIPSIVSEIKLIATGILKEDVSTISGFSERQVKAIAEQTIKIKAIVVKGDADENLKKFFYRGLKEMTTNFVCTLKGLIITMIEKIINAIIKALWKFIETI